MKATDPGGLRGHRTAAFRFVSRRRLSSRCARFNRHATGGTESDGTPCARRPGHRTQGPSSGRGWQDQGSAWHRSGQKVTETVNGTGPGAHGGLGRDGLRGTEADHRGNSPTQAPFESCRRTARACQRPGLTPCRHVGRNAIAVPPFGNRCDGGSPFGNRCDGGSPFGHPPYAALRTLRFSPARSGAPQGAGEAVAVRGSREISG